MMLKLFNFRENWNLVNPHLSNKALIETLNSEMYLYIKNRIIECEDEGLDTSYWEATTFDYTKGDMPYTLCSSDAIYCPACQTSPEHDSYRAFQLWGGCHWINVWSLELGKLMFPDYEWNLLVSDLHTTAIGIKGNDKIVFDILFFEHGNAKSIIDIASGKIDMRKYNRSYKQQHIYENGTCTCWDNIEAYRSQIEEMDNMDDF